MKVLVLGDCHGHLNLIHRLCIRAQEMHGVEAAIQVGDLGLYPGIMHKFLHEGPRRFPIPLHAIDGNHEDHGWLTSARTDGTVAGWETANLFLHDRGTVAEIGGAYIGFLGGALHADRRQEWSGQWAPTANDLVPLNKRRIPRSPVWANWVTEGDVERALSAFTSRPPDLLVTHSCPAGIGIGIVGALPLVDDVERFITKAGHWSGPFTDCGEGGLTTLWRVMVMKPRTWVFGHFHRLHDKTVDGTRFVCVGSSDGSDGARFPPIVLYDTLQRRVTIHG